MSSDDLLPHLGDILRQIETDPTEARRRISALRAKLLGPIRIGITTPPLVAAADNDDEEGA